MRGARGLLISITGGKDLTLHEVDEAATRIREEVDADANIIVGANLEEGLDGVIRVSVVATGVDINSANNAGPAVSPQAAAPPHEAPELLVCKGHLNPMFPPGSRSARLLRGVVCRSDLPKSVGFVGLHRLIFFKLQRTHDSC